MACSALLIAVAPACSAGDLGDSDDSGKVTITFLTDNGANTAISKGLAKAFMASNKKIKVKVNTRPGGTEGDNLIKTRLSTGAMDDVFLYNSGSLFQQINPAKNLQSLDGSITGSINKTFYPQVTAKDRVFGVPIGTAFAGGILYNIPIYKRLGLSIPKTWDQFIANSKKIKAAGIPAVLQTYGGTDTWTSQVLVLADFHNVAQADPSFAKDFTVNKAKFATSKDALKGFQRLQQIHDLGFENKDFAAKTNAQGLSALATGKAAQYPMLSALVATIKQNNPAQLKDVGFFAQPGDNADAAGATAWYPNALYVPKSTTGAKLNAVKKFLAFAVTTKACSAETNAALPTGPYLIKGCALPDDVPQVTKDVAAYFDSGKQSPALEFLSPVKGPNLENYCVQAGSGIINASTAASQYDQDVKKQAQQLGLPGW